MQLTVLALSHGSCFGDVSWSVAIAGSNQSTMAGVLAGFVFSGIVAVLAVRATLGVRATGGGKEAANALKLMFCAFIGLTVAAYLFGDQAADGNCLRASSEEILAGGILATFAIIMIVSLTWLVAAYDMHQHGVLRFLRRLLYVAMAFVMLLLCTSSYSYLQADVFHGPPLAVVVWIYVAGGLLYAIGLPVTLQSARFLLALRGHERKPGYHRWDWVIEYFYGKFHILDFCAGAALVYLAAAAIGDALVISTNDSYWERPSSVIIYAVAWSFLVAPLIILILAMHALPTEQNSRHAEKKSNTAATSPTTPALVGNELDSSERGDSM